MENLKTEDKLVA